MLQQHLQCCHAITLARYYNIGLPVVGLCLVGLRVLGFDIVGFAVGWAVDGESVVGDAEVVESNVDKAVVSEIVVGDSMVGGRFSGRFVCWHLSWLGCWLLSSGLGCLCRTRGRFAGSGLQSCCRCWLAYGGLCCRRSVCCGRVRGR